MGSHNSSFTGRKWNNSGSLERSWQDPVPFVGIEFHNFFPKMAAKMVENILNISHNSAIYEPI